MAAAEGVALSVEVDLMIWSTEGIPMPLLALSRAREILDTNLFADVEGRDEEVRGLPLTRILDRISAEWTAGGSETASAASSTASRAARESIFGGASQGATVANAEIGRPFAKQ